MKSDKIHLHISTEYSTKIIILAMKQAKIKKIKKKSIFLSKEF